MKLFCQKWILNKWCWENGKPFGKRINLFLFFPLDIIPIIRYIKKKNQYAIDTIKYDRQEHNIKIIVNVKKN